MAITLKAARVNKSLTQKQAAESLGITQRTLSAWENGESFPDVEKIRRLEALYGVSYADIIFMPSQGN